MVYCLIHNPFSMHVEVNPNPGYVQFFLLYGLDLATPAAAIQFRKKGTERLNEG